MLQSRIDDIRQAFGGLRADILIVLGSGMSSCFTGNEFEVIHDGGPAGVHGHTGRLVRLRGARANVLVSLGRRHLYEGHAAKDVVATVRAACELGVRSVVLTNAAGGLNPSYQAGSIMLIDECITMMMARSLHALAGYGVSGMRYPGDVGADSLFAVERHASIIASAMACGVRLERGVYAAVPGPSYETRAEIRMLRRMDADAVGMSTLLEACEARRNGADVIGLSLITNTLSDTIRTELTHADVVEQGRLGGASMRAVLDCVIAELCG